MDDRELFCESTRAITHMAESIVTIRSQIAAVVQVGESRGLAAMLERNHLVAEGLAAILYGMVGFTEEDDWLGPILKALRQRVAELKALSQCQAKEERDA